MNADLRILFQLRISFERTNGGGFHQQVWINQIQLEMETKSNSSFYASIVFLGVTIIELFLLIRHLVRKQHKFSTIMHFVFFVVNVVIINYWIQRLVSLNRAMVEFELDPRSVPPFEPVFLFQRQLQSAISIVLFCRTLYLMKALSGLNSVKRTIKVMKRLMIKFTGWLLFMIPFTMAFGIAGLIFLNHTRLGIFSVLSLKLDAFNFP